MPPHSLNKKINTKKTSSHLFSITFRPRSGIDLGNICHSALVDFFKSKALYYALTAEKFDKHEPFECHYQGALYFDETQPPLRQDNLRRSLLTILTKGYNLDEKELKHALEVRPHNNADVLFEYCLKEVLTNDPTGLRILFHYKKDFKSYPIRMCECSNGYSCYHCIGEINKVEEAKHEKYLLKVNW